MEDNDPISQNIPSLLESILPHYRDKLRHISQSLWENPELAYNEYSAHTILTEFLSQNGFTVKTSYHLPTAFKATFHTSHETPSDNIIKPCIICEYDALPSIGHACGHNLIAIAGIATGVIIKDLMLLQSDKFCDCLLTIMGTPAEEEGGGKIDLIKAGAFEGLDFAMMVHPYPCNILYPPIMMMGCYKVKYSRDFERMEKDGSCLDSAVLAYNSIGMLRQQFKHGMRIHGVITKGGSFCTASPDKVEMEWDIRASTLVEYREIESKALKCFEAAAKVFDCKCEILPRAHTHYNMVTNTHLAEIFRQKSSIYGLKFDTKSQDKTKSSFSTDMGNVSYLLPSIHPKYAIPNEGPNHTKAFADASNAMGAFECTLAAAKALALTAIEIMLQPELLLRIREEFNDQTT